MRNVKLSIFEEYQIADRGLRILEQGVRSQEPEEREQKSEIRGQKSDGRGFKILNMEQQNKEPHNAEVITSIFDISCSIFCGSKERQLNSVLCPLQ